MFPCCFHIYSHFLHWSPQSHPWSWNQLFLNSYEFDVLTSFFPWIMNICNGTWNVESFSEDFQLVLSIFTGEITISSVQLSHVRFCNPMDCSTPGFPIRFHQLPEPTQTRPSCWWCHPTISSSVVPFSSHLQSFPASGFFPMSQLSASGGQSIGASAST